MNATINLLGIRLKTLMDSYNFRYDFEKIVDSPEQLLAIGEHNLREYEKLEAAGEEYYERIENLFANKLASRLQEEAIARYGNTEDNSIRQVLCDWFNRPEDRVFEDRLRQTAKLALLNFNLTEEQSEVLKGMFDKLPQVIMEGVEQLMTPMRLLPRAEAQSIVMALVDVMKEETRNADSQRHN